MNLRRKLIALKGERKKLLCSTIKWIHAPYTAEAAAEGKWLIFRMVGNIYWVEEGRQQAELKRLLFFPLCYYYYDTVVH